MEEGKHREYFCQSKTTKKVYSGMEHPDEDNSILNDLVYRNPEEEKESTSFFWRPHTISVLVVLLFMLFYVTFVEEDIERSGEYNSKRGILACCGVFIAFGITQARDGPITRPHPVFWRFILCLSIIYELWMIFLLFQTRDDARRWMSYIDPQLGQMLPEQDYGGNCLIYDSKANDPWHNVKDKLDIFVIGHLIGWWGKTLILRDYWISIILSVLFEFLEYTLQHQLPNFSECWWDHWIMDFLVCNGAGIYAGMLTLQYLEIKTYTWGDIWSIPTYGGKFKRIIGQFTPYSWRKFKWGATRSIKHWIFVSVIIIMFLFAELNVFYLKAALWIPPNHLLVVFRLVLFFLVGLVTVREAYDFLTDDTCKKLGQQCWVMCAIIITEIFVDVKFMKDVVWLALPRNIIVFWGVVTASMLVYTCWLFLPDFLGFNDQGEKAEVINLKED